MEQTNKTTEYEFTDDMAEISGFGGGYEESCRKMVITGVNWLDNHRGEAPEFRQNKNITGLLWEDNEAAEEMTEHMNEVIDNDSTGAMMQFCVNHALYIRKHGWDKYKELKVKQKQDEDQEGKKKEEARIS